MGDFGGFRGAKTAGTGNAEEDPYRGARWGSAFPTIQTESIDMKRLIAVAGFTALISALPTFSAAQDKKEEPKKEESPHTFTGNFTLASEYRYRGIAQTNSKPAVQGGFDYSHSSGFYVGTWASNVSWLSDASTSSAPISSSLEWDFYGGYKGTVGDFGYDVGVLQYWYPGKYPSGFNKPDTFEGYVAGTWKMLTLKYSYAFTDLFGATDSKGAGYTDLTGNFELPEGFTLVAHVGYQYIPGTTGYSKSDRSYTDWKLGVTKEWVGLTFGLFYLDTNAKGDSGQFYRNAYNKDLGRSTALFSVTKTF